MTTSKNVTELQPRMTREQLIDAARTAAKHLPVASAQLMNELATRLATTCDDYVNQWNSVMHWLLKTPYFVKT